MIESRSLLTGAAMVLLAAACSDGPTSPRDVAPSSKSVMEMPSVGPVFTVNPGSLELGMTPPGGVTSGSTGSATEIGGQMLAYSNIQSGNFAFLAWTPGTVGLMVNGAGGTPLSFEGMSGGGDDDVVSGAVWSGTLNATINGQLVNVPVRVVFNAAGLQSAANLDSLGVSPTYGAVAVIPGTTLSVHVAGEAFYQGMWQPMNAAFASIGQEIGQTMNPSLMLMTGFFWKIKSCDAGNYMDVNAGGCQASPAGSYSPGGYATSATQCATGTYQPNTGQSSCIDADAGYYVNQTGQTSQTACGSGKYQPDTGQFGCLSAPPGSYATGTAQTSVTLCSPGYYSSGYGNTSCAAAPRGTYVEGSGATAPVACAAGSYNNSTGQSSCQLAPAGYYTSSTGSFIPTKCAAGSYSATSGSTSCTLAPAGSYAPQPSGSSGATSAILCAAGTFTSTAGQASCTSAPAGSYVSGTGATSATQCASGYYQPSTGQTSCIAAAAGSYAAGPGAIASSLCAAGSYSSGTASASCTLASPGSYVASMGATSSTQCAAGYYQPNSGAASCIAASIGFYVSTTGATSQTACAIGYTTNSTASTSCVRMDPIVAYDALISTAQTTPGVAASEVNKLVTARKQLVAGKPAAACKAIDGFVSYVNKQTNKTISASNAAILIRKTQDADAAIGC